MTKFWKLSQYPAKRNHKNWVLVSPIDFCFRILFSVFQFCFFLIPFFLFHIVKIVTIISALLIRQSGQLIWLMHFVKSQNEPSLNPVVEMLNLQLLQHLIIGRNKYFSAVRNRQKCRFATKKVTHCILQKILAFLRFLLSLFSLL